jgi:NAD(P)-dependent dehydrogenase (short-subunit alcohol dehydrogenase family)
MRARGKGHIVNVTSMGGFITMPGIAFYCGSKFALEGISESLGKELAGLGIHVTALAPGQFRTDWAGRSMDRTPRSIADYDAVMDPIRKARQGKSGHQPGDLARGGAGAAGSGERRQAACPPVPWRGRVGAGRCQAGRHARRDRPVAGAVALHRLCRLSGAPAFTRLIVFTRR